MIDDYAKAQSDATTPVFNRAVERDLVLKDGDTVTLGKTSLKVYVTPGHTPGCASFEFTVYDKGKPYKAFMFGGPEPRDGVEGGKKFLASVNRVAQMEPDVQVGLLIHSWLANSTYPNGGTFERAARLALRRGNDPNPFVDPASWQAWMPKLKMVADKFIADAQASATSPTAAR
jgi:metallo-beta-lactamase class B